MYLIRDGLYITYCGHYLKLYMCLKESVVFIYSGALTKGDRRAATGAEFSEFNFDTQYGRSALRQMYNSLRTVSCFLHCLVTFVICVTHYNYTDPNGGRSGFAKGLFIIGVRPIYYTRAVPGISSGTYM